MRHEIKENNLTNKSGFYREQEFRDMKEEIEKTERKTKALRLLMVFYQSWK
jgi:hypothetical protein